MVLIIPVCIFEVKEELTCNEETVYRKLSIEKVGRENFIENSYLRIKFHKILEIIKKIKYRTSKEQIMLEITSNKTNYSVILLTGRPNRKDTYPR